MVKRVSFFITIFTICVFAENTTGTGHVATEAEAAPAVETEAVEAEQIAAEVEAAPAVEAQVVAAAPVVTEPAKESIIDNPIEFAIVTAVFIATVLLITLTGN